MFKSFKQFLQEDFNSVRKKFTSAGNDKTEVDDYITRFKVLNNNQRLQGDEKNIDYWGKRSFDEFKQFIERKEKEKTKTSQRKEVGKRIDLLNIPGWNIFVPIDKAAACYKTDKATDWCVAKRDQEYFAQYVYNSSEYSFGRNVLIYCLRDSDKKYWAILLQLSEIDGEISLEDEPVFYDADDNSLRERDFEIDTKLKFDVILKAFYSKMKEVFQGIDTEKNNSISYLLTKTIKLHQRNPDLEKKIIQNKDYDSALRYVNIVELPFPEEGLFLFANKSENAVNYAQYILKKPWSTADVPKNIAAAAEKTILSDPYDAVNYARAVLKRRWPELESTLIQSIKKHKHSFNGVDYMGSAIRYAGSVIRKRWPELEPYITEPYQITTYVREVVRDRFLEGERRLLNYSKENREWWDLINYINIAFKPGQRWIEAEPVIVEYASVSAIVNYADNQLGGAWDDPKFEIPKEIVEKAHESIAESAADSYRYAMIVTKKRFKLGEPTMKERLSFWDWNRYAATFEIQGEEE